MINQALKGIAIWILYWLQMVNAKFFSIPLLLSAPRDDGSLEKRFESHQEYITNKYADHSIRKRSDRSIEKRSDVSLYNDANIAYYIPIQVGTPPQEFNVLLDTSADTLWIPSINCINCRNFQYFRANESTTYYNSSQYSPVGFATGYVWGHWSTDTVKLGPYNASNQSIIVVREVSSFTSAGDYGVWDGLIGFALNQFPTDQAASYKKTFFQNLVASGLEKNMFGIKLKYSASGSRVYGGGDLTIGGLNESHYVGDLTWLDVAQMPAKDFKMYWALRLTGFAARPKNTDDSNISPAPVGGYAILDTGSTFIYIDKTSFETLFLNNESPVKLTKRGALYVLNCDDAPNLPTLVFYLNEKRFALNNMEYVIKSNGLCVLGVSAVNSIFSNQLTWVLGVPFLQKFYTAYDYDNAKIGISVASFAIKTCSSYLAYLLPIVIICIMF